MRVLDLGGILKSHISHHHEDFISGILQIPAKHAIYLADANGNQVWEINTDSDTAEALFNTEHTGQMILSPDNTKLGFTDVYGFAVFDTRTNELLLESEWIGKSGVRYYGQEPGSCKTWDSKIKYHPDSNQFLLNVPDGQVWKINLATREKQAIPRSVINFVEDTHWLDENRFPAIDSFGCVNIVNITMMECEFQIQDFQE